MILWLVLGFAIFVAWGVAQQYLHEKHRRVLLNIALSILVLIVSGFLTRIILVRINGWLAGYFAAGGPLTILGGVGMILVIPIVFALLVLMFFIIIQKVKKR